MTGFWIFMFIFNLLMPLTMIGFGHLFLKQVPNKVNSLFGYRTSRSMKNQETWKFANAHIGKIWEKWGLVSLFLSIVIMIGLLGQDKDTIGQFGGLLSGVQVFLLIASIFPTESALKKTFDENGRRKN
jgi:uncharacterized membrane protein